MDHKTNIYSNPVKLLKAIKEYALNYQELRYNMVIVSDAFRAFLNCRYYSEESL